MRRRRAFYDLKKPGSARSACARISSLSPNDVEQRIAERVLDAPLPISFLLSSCATRRSTLERAFIQGLLICMLN